MATASTSSPAAPVNHYIRRLAATPKSCLVCYRPSPHVLVSQSIPQADFFYVCASHLDDRHFATKIAPTAAKGAAKTTQESRLPDQVSQSEIERIKKEYDERQRQKQQKQKQQAEGTDEEEKKKKQKEEEEKKKGSSWFSGLSALLDSPAADAPAGDKATTPSSTATVTAAAGGSHERYTLHRDFYQMRLEAHKKREAVRRAKDLNLPPAPKTSLTS